METTNKDHLYNVINEQIGRYKEATTTRVTWFTERFALSWS